MKKSAIIILMLGLAAVSYAQKSRVLSVFQMIDQGKYSEARDAIELAIWNDKTSRWPRTWYAKGLLCQTAYEEGIKKNDRKKTTLYPDQLYVAYDAYEKAIELDVRERLHHNISTHYYHLSNDFRKLGSDHFSKKEYEEALRAFEHALLIDNSKLVHAKTDTSLVYNTALAAYECENWEKAIAYLTGLHDAAHKPGTSLLLYQAHLENGDSTRAEEVLMEGVKLYKYETQVVVYLVNLFVQSERPDLAIKVLDEAIAARPGIYQFHWGRGLIYRRMGVYDKAIESFNHALELKPDEPTIYYHLGVIYYNQGVDLSDQALQVRNNDQYQALQEQSNEKFQEAVRWLEKSYELDPFDQKTISKLYQLYYQLQMKQKEEKMKLLMEQ
jgi:tetratricopeptide (TPR) repeat protein